jgi:hypothetical protein
MKLMNLEMRRIFVHTSQVIFTCRKILRQGASGFTSSPKEVVLQIFVALRKSIASAGFEPANLGSSGKHAKHYATHATSN